MKRPVVVGVSAGIALIIVGFILFSRTGPPRPPVKPTKDSRAADDSALEFVQETLQKATSADLCRKAVQKLNSHLDRNPEQRPQPLAHPEVMQKQLGLDADELAEVRSGSFTLLDAHHLDLCLLLRDAARSLEVEGLPPLERAKTAFAWVMRQVQLREAERPEPLLPPQYVLRRGWGTSQERAIIFLDLLRQIDIHGCMMTVPGNDQSGRQVYWIPGALIDKEIYLFDTRLGLPLPGPEGEEIATLRQIRAQGNPFQALAIDDQHHYDVTAEQVKGAEIHLICSLSEAAPRVKYLESVLSQPKKISLAVDPAKLAEEFQEATRAQDIPIHFWGELGEANAPGRVLRNYFPPEEGGADKTGRMRQSFFLVAPRGSIPPVLFNTRVTQFGQNLAFAFISPFTEFYLSPRGPRETALRGSFDEASTILINAPVTLRFPEVLIGFLGNPLADQVRREDPDWLRMGVHRLNLQALKQQEIDPNIPANLEQKVAEWSDLAIDAQGQFSLAQQAFEAGNLPEANLTASRKKLIQVWKDGEKLLSALFLKTNSYPLGAAATYLLALCKHERALQVQARLKKFGPHPPQAEEEKAQGAWKQAATWWRNYEFEYGAATEMPAARLRLAEALIHLGEQPAALAQLEDLSGGLTKLEETARLYQARHLRKGIDKK
jgi:hypothetical protein